MPGKAGRTVERRSPFLSMGTAPAQSCRSVLTAWQLAAPGEQIQETASCHVFHNLAADITFSHFYNILFTQVIPFLCRKCLYKGMNIRKRDLGGTS